ncbi:MAG TPA: acyl-CoA thioesterase [Alteromonas australica]|jgi:acyl-CoA thioester hydrolase|uniref:Thioesterase n=1 Tax=Alteromonas australica TaxID=589873 RepID=A0A075PB70_9ALTE|nr:MULTISPECIES: thioesterase family protein [Alteromonas]MAB93820.1 acyl-CoA thioesterase [Alteromonas sp.]AIG00593.1 thioesterase [Alteromonas australica]MAF69099.1 acyl-CoA thioesterase [Alteromonas sp.]MAF72163.1 acyl-CoA thioesterase [Alteromonas sp.]MAO29373.1 acyl-CoA thioesterase [Alteromonas sp.]|tara:strand:- start:1300 stop:1749 length:450 start_codon:yes stop_codon:yes gene_type:complete
MTDITPSLSDYPYHVEIATRWQDNDAYGHINNVMYYSFFDTAVNRFLIEEGGLNIHKGNIVAYVVSSQCQYITPASYPETIFVGVRVIKVGRSSVTYGLSVYAGEAKRRVAHGQFVHVFVERLSDKAVPIPVNTKEALAAIFDESIENV